MKRLLLLAFLGLATPCAFAQSPVTLPLEVGHMVTKEGREYEGASIVAEHAVGVTVKHEGGLARVPFAKLPNDLAKKFAASAQAGAAQLAEEEQKKKEASASPAAGEGSAPAPAPSRGGDKPAEMAPAPGLSKEDSEKIAVLHKRIAALEVGILRSQEKISKFRQEADSIRRDAAKEKKAKALDENAAEEQTRLAEAERQKSDAWHQIETLESQANQSPSRKPAAAAYVPDGATQDKIKELQASIARWQVVANEAAKAADEYRNRPLPKPRKTKDGVDDTQVRDAAQKRHNELANAEDEKAQKARALISQAQTKIAELQTPPQKP